MTSGWSLPRTALSVRVQLTMGEPLAGEIFLMDRSERSAGPETVLEMLNRADGFFPFRPAAPVEGAPVLLVAKPQVVGVTTDGAEPLADPDRLSAAQQAGLTVELVTGTAITGRVHYEARAGHSRLLDFLNAAPDPFFALTADTVTHYLNRAHVVYVRPVD